MEIINFNNSLNNLELSIALLAPLKRIKAKIYKLIELRINK